MFGGKGCCCTWPSQRTGLAKGARQTKTRHGRNRTASYTVFRYRSMGKRSSVRRAFFRETRHVKQTWKKNGNYCCHAVPTLHLLRHLAPWFASRRNCLLCPAHLAVAPAGVRPWVHVQVNQGAGPRHQEALAPLHLKGAPSGPTPTSVSASGSVELRALRCDMHTTVLLPTVACMTTVLS